MKVNFIKAAICIALMLLCERNQVHATDVSYEEPTSSPDGRFSARLVSRNSKMDVDHLEINDEQTGEVGIVGVLTPLLVIQWTHNSNAIVTVEHISGGSISSIILRDNSGRWRRQEIKPPDESYENCAVVNQVIRPCVIEVTYKWTREFGGGVIPRFYLGTIQVDGGTGKTVRVLEKRQIEIDDYRRTRAVGR